MEISTNSSLVAPLLSGSGGKTQQPVASGNPTPSSGSSHAASASVSAVQPQDLAQALKHLQDQVGQNSSITLRAGLDSSGEHPGQVLVELMDKATQQVFYHYYMPADKVLQAAKNAEGLTPGSLLKGKA